MAALLLDLDVYLLCRSIQSLVGCTLAWVQFSDLATSRQVCCNLPQAFPAIPQDIEGFFGTVQNCLSLCHKQLQNILDLVVHLTRESYLQMLMTSP